MKSTPETSVTDGGFDLMEIRYSLREMLAEVASDREGNAYGMERLQSEDIKKAFKAKPKKRRGPKT